VGILFPLGAATLELTIWRIKIKMDEEKSKHAFEPKPFC
jgi:hypothetical protein